MSAPESPPGDAPAAGERATPFWAPLRTRMLGATGALRRSWPLSGPFLVMVCGMLCVLGMLGLLAWTVSLLSGTNRVLTDKLFESQAEEAVHIEMLTTKFDDRRVRIDRIEQQLTEIRQTLDGVIGSIVPPIPEAVELAPAPAAPAKPAARRR